MSEDHRPDDPANVDPVNVDSANVKHRAEDDALDAMAAALRDETRTPASERVAATRRAILRAHEERRARARMVSLAAAAIIGVVGMPTAWALYTGHLELDTWFGGASDSPRDAVVVPASPERTLPGPAPIDADARTASPPPSSPLDLDPPSAEAIDEPDRAPTDRALAERTATPSDRAPRNLDAPDRPRTTTDEIAAAPRVTTEVMPVTRPGLDTAHTPAVDAPAVDTPVVDRPVVDRPAADAERSLYEAAHAQHFEAHDTTGALTAWDAYLASYPSGRFAVEARYNRALTLVRLGRLDEAREALASFARGDHGAYREREARRLLDAIGTAE